MDLPTERAWSDYTIGLLSDQSARATALNDHLALSLRRMTAAVQIAQRQRDRAQWAQLLAVGFGGIGIGMAMAIALGLT